MRVPFDKPHINVNQQIALLRERGMEITDEDKAAEYLERIGYFRLKGYWHPFRESTHETDGHGQQVLALLESFKPGSQFSTALDLYVFDKRLRLLCLDALERIEVALRVEIALVLGSKDPIAHRQSTYLNKRFTKPAPEKDKSDHEAWLARLDKAVKNSREEFIVHFLAKHGSELPIWIAIEIWDFGMLTQFFDGLRYKERQHIATTYNLPSGSMLESWLQNLKQVRNVSAHHGRLWNRNVTRIPTLPKLGKIPELDHVVQDRHAQSRLYTSLSLIQYMMVRLNPKSTWSTRLKSLMSSFPNAPGLSLRHAGLPTNWQDQPLWNP